MLEFHDNVVLQFTTARIITNYDNRLLQFTIDTLLQFTTTVFTIHDRYYNSRQLLLQFTTGIAIHDRTPTPPGDKGGSNAVDAKNTKHFTYLGGNEIGGGSSKI